MVAGTPTISVDRLVGKYWSSIDVNTDAISDFYESLPIDNKIPLDECHIHFSGLAKLLDGSVYKGACAYESGAIAKIDSVAPTESDIVIFLGSSLKWGEADEDVDHVVAHELTHFAAKQSTNPSKITDKERELRIDLSAQAGCLDKINILGLVGVCYAANALINHAASLEASPPALATAGLTSAILVRLFDRKKRRAKIKAIRAQLHELYLAEDHEVLAEKHVEDLVGAVKVGKDLEFDKNLIPYTVNRRGAGNWIANVGHRMLSIR